MTDTDIGSPIAAAQDDRAAFERGLRNAGLPGDYGTPPYERGRNLGEWDVRARLALWDAESVHEPSSRLLSGPKC